MKGLKAWKPGDGNLDVDQSGISRRSVKFLRQRLIVLPLLLVNAQNSEVGMQAESARSRLPILRCQLLLLLGICLQARDASAEA